MPKVPKVETVGDRENLRKLQFLFFLSFSFLVFCCLHVMNFGVLSFMLFDEGASELLGG